MSWLAVPRHSLAKMLVRVRVLQVRKRNSVVTICRQVVAECKRCLDIEYREHAGWERVQQIRPPLWSVVKSTAEAGI